MTPECAARWAVSRLVQLLERPEEERGLSSSTVRHRASHLKAFVRWLRGQEGYRRLSDSNPDYFELHRLTQRKIPQGRADETALTADIVTLASEYGRHGYRRITALLRDAGRRQDRMSPSKSTGLFKRLGGERSFAAATHSPRARRNSRHSVRLTRRTCRDRLWAESRSSLH